MELENSTVEVWVPPSEASNQFRPSQEVAEELSCVQEPEAEGRIGNELGSGSPISTSVLVPPGRRRVKVRRCMSRHALDSGAIRLSEKSLPRKVGTKLKDDKYGSGLLRRLRSAKATGTVCNRRGSEIRTHAE
jgi:hypothetical protein